MKAKEMNIVRYNFVAFRSALRILGCMFKQKKRAFVRKKNVTSSVLYDDVIAWQKKQIASMTFEDSVPRKSRGVIDMARMRTLHRKTVREVKHQESGMWKVSTDTLQQGRGISLDQSIVLMHRLRDAGFPDDALGVVSVQLERQRHSFTIIQHREDDFWMLDNGFFSVFPVRASRFLAKRDDLAYLIGFNFFDVWTY